MDSPQVRADITLQILPQPNDETCGPTALHAVYSFLGDRLPLERVIAEVSTLATGGTLAAYLGAHALSRGYRVTLYTFNLTLFDPTWFEPDAGPIAERLAEQAAIKQAEALQVATRAYLEFIEAGGMVRFEELTPDLIRRQVARGLPLMSGLSATYLYGSARERYEGGESIEDSVGGHPTGHFVVLHGYDPSTDSVLVADPLHDNPLGPGPSYRVGMTRVLGAVLLGVLTFDGNLLLVEPAKEGS